MRRRVILGAGAGSFEQAHVTLTRGVHIGDSDNAAEQVAARWAEIGEREGSVVLASSWAQGQSELEKAG